MGLREFFLKPVSLIAGYRANTCRRKFLRAHQNTRDVQQQLLERLVEAHAGTGFGKDHNLLSVKTMDDFRKAVPLSTYDYYRPYIDRVREGDFKALMPNGVPPLMFSMTSGTTGTPKYIPVTQPFADQMKMGWNAFGIGVIRDHMSAFGRSILSLTSTMHEETSPAGIPCGAISGLLAQNQQRLVRRMYPTPQWVSEIPEIQTRFYTILRYAIERNVAFITTANPSTTIQLIEAARDQIEPLLSDLENGTFTPPGDLPKTLAHQVRAFRANPRRADMIRDRIDESGTFTARCLWDLSFVANWTGGTLGLYLPKLRKLTGGAPIRDIGLLASEGRFNLPIRDNTSAGVAEILSNVLEFIPVEQREKDNPETLLAHELEVGHEYFLVFSNFTSLMRYDIDDRIRVVDFYGQSPVFEFLSRGKHTANITGEKLTEHQVVTAMECTSRDLQLHVDQFYLQGHFADTPYYELHVDSPIAATTLSRCFDHHLRLINMEYNSKRKTDRLGPIQVHISPQGTFTELEQEEIRKRNLRAEQYKPNYLRPEIMPDDDTAKA
ncbi:MAG: GH3 auxin-responsive promoter family protein [Phycisphaerales bacterium]|jgi:hypothetical protein|nr:GH3 auxin-responsive promoter family protein [Phycisphaerales bacterium]MBT7171735.1 GH3 auxin-responsive promoter family protein [Phycisphaerales bacterium]